MAESLRREQVVMTILAMCFFPVCFYSFTCFKAQMVFSHCGAGASFSDRTKLSLLPCHAINLLPPSF